MAQPRLILDSGGVSAIVSGDTRALAWIALATQRRYLIGIPAPVLAEVMTGRPSDAFIHRALAPIDSCLPTTVNIAIDAGILRFRTRLTDKTVDALVIATAASLPGSVVLTSDPRDLQIFANERPDAGLLIRSVNTPPKT
jgi:predicted nucleic acid-binding protein